MPLVAARSGRTSSSSRRLPRSLPYEVEFSLTSTSSRTPLSASQRASAKISGGRRETNAPRKDDVEPPEQSAVPLAHYLWILRRHRWKIIAFVFACVTAALIVSARLTPVYESTVTVDIDRQIRSAIIGQDAGLSPLNDADQFLATQVKLIQSDSVLRPVAQQYHLLD